MNLSRCCRGFVDSENTLMDRESVKNLSAGQRAQNFARWIKEAIEILSRRNPESSMDRDSVKICREKKKEGLDKRESIEDL